jgi:hypothetical protein
MIVSLFLKLDVGALWKELISARWTWIAAAAALNLTVVFMKALRWQWFMRPQNAARIQDILNATVIGMAGNNLLPARGGDWLKIYLIGKWQSTCKTGLISVAGLDKLFDGLSLLILFGILSMHSTFPQWVKDGTIVFSIAMILLLSLSIFLLLHHRHEQNEMPKSWRRIRNFAAKLGNGLSALKSLRLTTGALALSILASAAQILTIWLCQKAYGLSLDMWVPAIVFVAVNLAIMIPSAPSGVGPFEMAAMLTYSWLGIKSEVGFSVALMYHAVQFIPITLAGVVLYLETTRRSAHKGMEKAKTMVEVE